MNKTIKIKPTKKSVRVPTIRIDPESKNLFDSKCRGADKSASEVIREFIRQVNDGEYTIVP